MVSKGPGARNELVNHGADGNGPIESSGRREEGTMKVCGRAQSVWRPQEPPMGWGAVIVGHVEPTDRGWVMLES